MDDQHERPQHNNPFEYWLALQLRLQIEAFGSDPRALGDTNRAEFMVWNAFAAEDELHEAMQELGWKPWASSRHLNHDAFLGEIVDALHFIGNMVLAAAVEEDMQPWQLAEILWAMYQDKVQINIDRQRKGYTGLDKCNACARDLVGDPSGEGLYCPTHPQIDQTKGR